MDGMMPEINRVGEVCLRDTPYPLSEGQASSERGIYPSMEGVHQVHCTSLQIQDS